MAASTGFGLVIAATAGLGIALGAAAGEAGGDSASTGDVTLSATMSPTRARRPIMLQASATAGLAGRR